MKGQEVVWPGRNMVVIVDLTPGPWLEQSRVVLDGVLFNLVQEVGPKPGTLGLYRLDVFEMTGGTKPSDVVFCWAPSWGEAL